MKSRWRFSRADVRRPPEPLRPSSRETLQSPHNLLASHKLRRVRNRKIYGVPLLAGTRLIKHGRALLVGSAAIVSVAGAGYLVASQPVGARSSHVLIVPSTSTSTAYMQAPTTPRVTEAPGVVSTATSVLEISSTTSAVRSHTPPVTLPNLLPRLSIPPLTLPVTLPTLLSLPPLSITLPLTVPLTLP